MATQTIGKAVLQLVTDTSAFFGGLDKAQKQVQIFGQSVTDVGKGLKTFGTQLSSLGKGMTVGLTAPLVAIGAAAIKLGTDFNASMANVATLIPGNAARIQELKGTVQDLAVATGKSTTDLSDGLYQVVSAFGDTSDSAKILEINARAAAAGLATTTDAINLTSAVTKGYGDTSAAAVQQVSDLAFQAVKLGQTSFPELAASIGRVTPLTAELGVSQQELFGVMATFTGVTGKAADVSTQLRGVLQGLLVPTEDMRALFAKLGVDSGKALIAQHGLEGAMKLVVSAANASGTPLQKYIGSIEGQTLALSATGAQADTFRQKLAAMDDVVGASEEAFREQSQGVNAAGFAWEQFKQEMIVAGQQLGDVIIPIVMDAAQQLRPLLDGVKSLVGWFRDLPEPVKTATVVFAGLLAALGPLLIAIGSLASAMGAALPILASVAIGVKAVGAAALVAAPQLLAFAVAAASVIKIGEAVRHTIGLWNDRLEQNRLVTEQNKSHQLALAEASRVVGRQITDLSEAMQILQRRNADLRAAALQQAAATEEQTQATGAAVQSAATFQSELAAVHRETAALTNAQKANIKAALDLGKSLKDISAATGVSEAAIKTYSERLKSAEKAAEDAAKANEKFRDSVTRTTTDLVPFKRAIDDAGAALHRLGSVSIAETAEESRKAKEEMEAWADANGARLAPSLKDVGTEAIRAAAEANSLGQAIKTNISDVIKGLPDLITSAFTGGGGIVGALKGLGTQIANAIITPIMAGLTRMQQGAVAIGSGIAGAVGNQVGGASVAAVASLAGTIGGAAIMATSFGAAMAGAIGTTAALGVATAGVGLAVVGVVAAYKKWFTVTKEVKQAREDLVKFEDAIRGALTEQQRAEAGGERWKEVLIGVRDTFLQTGRTAQDAERLVAQMFDTQNPERSREAIALVGQAYVELAEQQRILAEGTEEANAIFGELFSTAELMGNQMPDSLRPMIDTLVEMGVVTEETAAQLGAIGGEGEVSIAAMKKAAEEFGIEIDSLGPRFKQQQLTEESRRILNGIRLLEDGGADANVVLHGMTDEIQNVVSESRQFGTQIPENLRPYIARLAEGGRLVDENGDKLTDLSTLNFGPPVADQWQVITDKLQVLIDKITEALPRALDNIPDPTITIHVDDRELRDLDARVGQGGLNLDVVHAAAGGMGRVRSPTLFLAGEAGDEDFAFSGGGKRFGTVPAQRERGSDISLADLRSAFRGEFDAMRRVLAISLRDATAGAV